MLLDEQVHTVHLNNDHGAAQLVERIAWAITDAEDAERSRSSSTVGGQRTPSRPRSRVSATRSSRGRSRRQPARSTARAGGVAATR